MDFDKDRVNKIIDGIINVAKNDYSVQLEISDKNDELDSIAMGLNIMIEEIKKSVDEIHRDYDIQNVLNYLLGLQVINEPIEEILQKTLNKILIIPWLSLESKGAIFLVEGEPEKLVLKVQNGLAASIQTICAEIKFGQCLCGRAAQTGDFQYASGLDERHDVEYKGMTDHGHYCIPIKYSNKVLGVITTYLKVGHKRIEKEENFLTAVADVLAAIVEHKNMEKEKEKLREQFMQSEKMAAVGKLAGGFAHEINNPMTVILGYAQLVMLKIEKSNPLYKSLESIERESKRCRDLIRNLLTFSRISKTQAENTEINEVINSALSLVEAQTKIKNIRIERKYDDKLPKVMLNSNQIQQVIINLCNNAIDAMPNGGIIVITTRQKDGFAEILVSDTGSGIPKNIINKIYEPFFTTKEIGKGTGLGLSLCFDIIQKHKGEILVESEDGKGTTFVIRLPI